MAEDEPTAAQVAGAENKDDPWSWWIWPDFIEAIVWIIVGIGRTIASIALAVLSSCN